MIKADRLEKDEFGLYIHAPSYLDQRARMEVMDKKIKEYYALPWWKKLWYSTFGWKKGLRKFVSYIDYDKQT